MPAYRSIGGFDDTIVEDGDRGFVGVNQRLQLNQLQGGEVRESINGRMEGYWKPRKNVVVRSSPLTDSSVSGQLPMIIGEFAMTNIVVFAGGRIQFDIDGSEVAFEVGDEGYALITGCDAQVDGKRYLTAVGVRKFEFTVGGVTSLPTNAGIVSSIPLSDYGNSEIFCSCLFSDPNSKNKEYVLIAGSESVTKVDLKNYSTELLYYPQQFRLSGNTEMIQVFNEIILFREGQRALEWFPNGRPIISLVRTGGTFTYKVRRHGLTVGDTFQNVDVVGLLNGFSTVFAVIDDDTFTSYNYLMTGNQTYDVSNAKAFTAFTYAPAGVYSQPQSFSASSSGVSSTDGLVSVTVSGNTTIQTGDLITIYQCDIPLLSSFVGEQFVVKAATTTLIQFFAPVANITAGGSNKIEIGGQFSVGGGFIHQPGAPWGTYFQRRLWVPFLYDPQGTSTAPIYKPRGISDEVAVSDILDNHTFDQIENQFRISGGTADYVVAMHGFYDDGLVVLNRNSLHLISGTQGSLKDTVVKELTTEVGCLARKTAVIRGNVLFFLSDDGVYGLEFLNDYNLRGTEEPLSKNIQPYIDRINNDLVENSVATLYNNRYYLALPLDSRVGENDARGNNTVLVFNFLNKGWESIDTYSNPSFLIKDFVIGGGGTRNDLFCVLQNGTLNQMEAEESSYDSVNVGNTNASQVSSVAIQSKLVTRGFDFGTLERKRFMDAQLNIQGLQNEQSEYDIAFAAEDPDDAVPLGKTSEYIGGDTLIPSTSGEAETASVRFRLAGLRGHTGTLTLTRTIGSAKINSVKIAATITNRSITSQR
jgi:hypothetical protein